MALVRLKKYECDVLFTLNTEYTALKPDDVDMSSSETAPATHNGVDPTKAQQIEALFDQIVGSFRHTSEDELKKLFDC